MQQRALRWSLQARYRSLLRWRVGALLLRFADAPLGNLTGAAPPHAHSNERLQELLREVQIMKAAVGNRVGQPWE